MNNTLSLIRKKVGQGNIKKFVTKELGIKYRTFVYQTENGLVPYRVIKVILEKLDIEFSAFKDYEFQPEIKEVKKVVTNQKKIFDEIEELHIPKPKKLSEIFGGL